MGYPSVVTADELRELPLLALAALWARAARRCLHHFDPPGSTPRRHRYMNAVSEAVQIVWNVAKGIPAPASAERTLVRAFAASGKDDKGLAGVNAARAAGALGAALTALRGEPELAVRRASLCLSADCEEAGLIRQDYDRLLALGLGRFPELGEPIDPAALGPLWRDEEDG